MSANLTHCPICGGELRLREVEKVLRGGNHTAIMRVQAEVCLRCGERLYDPDTIRRFESIRDRLERQDVGDFHLIGQTFEVV